MDTTPFFADITMSELKKKELKDLAVCSPCIFGTAISYKHLVSVSLTIFAFFTAVRLMTEPYKSCGSLVMAVYYLKISYTLLHKLPYTILTIFLLGRPCPFTPLR